MSPEQIARAEKVAERLEARTRRRPMVEALSEAQGWSRPASLGSGRQLYYFTDEQFRIALESLRRKENDQFD